MNLTDEQRAAVEIQDRPVVLLAAAGSGKTTVLVERYLTLLARAEPHRILAVTFTNEAAEQLRTRVVKRLRDRGDATVAERVSQRSRIGTLHGFCYAVLDQFGSHLGLPTIREVISGAEFLSEFDREYREWRRELPAEALRRLVRYFGHLDLSTITRDLYQHRHDLERVALSKETEPIFFDTVESVRPLFARLENALIKEGRFTFDDLEQLTLKILTRCPTVAAFWQQELKFILVDEFQDTSDLQWEILQLILGSSLDKAFVVGDPKQSIYRFRKADVRVFFAAAAEMEAAGGMQLALTTNFRSAPPIIERINAISQSVFANSSVPFAPMYAGREAAEGGIVTTERFSEGGEAEHAAQIARKLVASGAAPESICFLTRVSDRIGEFLDALAQCDLPARGKQTHPLFATHDVVDIVNFLRAVQNPLDEFSLTAFLRSPYVGQSYAQLAELRTGGRTLFESIVKAETVPWFTNVIAHGELRVPILLGALVRHGKYFPRERAALLELLRNLGEREATLSETLAKLQLWEREDLKFVREESGPPGVTVMTVHGAKGLEFDHVFLVDNLRQLPRRAPPFRWAPGKRPGIRYREGIEVVCSESYEAIAKEDLAEEYEEGKRVLYVALTRARESLRIFLPEVITTIPKGSFGEMLLPALEP